MSRTPEQLADYIRRRAADLGFSRVGITSAAPLPEAQQRLEQWLGQRYQGSMDWMVRTRAERADPTAFFPNARSVVVLAMNYFRGDEQLEQPMDEGAISLYARGRDYHKVLRNKLKRLLKDLQIENPLIEGRICVDSFPLMEKPLAVRAGLGWIGKHTNLIDKSHGSWFFLGELLLTMELPVDEPFSTDHCGSCNRCQLACPTEALSTPYVLDASRCISYLTIEHEGDISPGLQAGMQNWVFGCDACQVVCPWNRFSSETPETDFYQRLDREQYRLDALAALSQKEFEALFAGTPVRRAGYQRFLRNVTIARGNL